MKMKKIFDFKFLLVLMSFAILSFKSHAKDLSDLIAEDILKSGNLVEINSDHRFYHYYHYYPNETVPMTPEQRQEYLISHMQGYANLAMNVNAINNGAMAYGPGLYAIQDPAYSRQYGYQALQLAVKPGEKYYLLRQSAALSSVTLEEIKKLSSGLDNSWYVLNSLQIGYKFFLNIINANLNSSYNSNDPFTLLKRKIFPEVLKAYKKLKIVGHLEGYTSYYAQSLCQSSTGEVAMIFGLHDEKNPNQADISMFKMNLFSVYDIPNQNYDEKSEIDLARKEYSFLTGNDLSIEALSKKLTPEEIDKFRKSLFPCKN